MNGCCRCDLFDSRKAGGCDVTDGLNTKSPPFASRDRDDVENDIPFVFRFVHLSLFSSRITRQCSKQLFLFLGFLLEGIAKQKKDHSTDKKTERDIPKGSFFGDLLLHRRHSKTRSIATGELFDRGGEQIDPAQVLWAR